MSYYFTRKIDSHSHQLNNDVMGKFITSYHDIHLDQPPSFYQKSEKLLRNYLNKVYPMARGTFAKMNVFDLAKFYNSLSFFYNCAYMNHNPQGLTGPKPCWSALDCVRTSKLPFVPQGYMYDWQSYRFHDLPVTYSDSSRNVSTFGSGRPSVPWGVSPIAKDGGLVGGEVSRSERSGPAPEWFIQRTIMRNTYYPQGLYFSDIKGWEAIGSCDALPIWQINPVQNGYIEVTHMGSPGGPPSPGTWYNGVQGTGLFYHMGRYTTHNNKFAAAFELLQELVTKSAKDLGLNISGKELLKKYYDTTDPYKAMWNIYIDQSQKYFPAKTVNNTYLVDPSSYEGIDNKGVLSASGLFSHHIGCPGKPYGPNGINTMREVTVYYQKKYCLSNSDKPTMKGWKACVDAAVNNTDYFANRVGTIVINDEVMFWGATLLNYDTIYLPFSTNANGYWQIEIVNTRFPHKEATDQVKLNRKYIYTMGPGPNYTPIENNHWWPWQKQFISLRDPLNINNASKPCIGPYKGSIDQLSCEGNELSIAYQTLPLYECAKLPNELPIPKDCPMPAANCGNTPVS